MQKCNRLTNIVTLIIEGITSQDFFTHEHLFPKLTANFPDRVEVMSPIYYGSDPIYELACVPLTTSQKNAILNRKYTTCNDTTLRLQLKNISAWSALYFSNI